MNGTDDFDFGPLENELLEGDGAAIYEQLHDEFRQIAGNRTAARVRALLEAQPEEVGRKGAADLTTRTAAAISRAMAESALAAVAIYLARQEHASPPPAQ